MQNNRSDSDNWPELSNYRIVREVARGGMGIVYEAEQIALGRRVALKTLATDRSLGPHAEERFQMEARSASRLHHSNIVPVFEVGRENGVSFYAMQFISGMGLDRVARRVGELLDSSKGGTNKNRSTRQTGSDSLADLLAGSMLTDDSIQPTPAIVPLEVDKQRTSATAEQQTRPASSDGDLDSGFSFDVASQTDSVPLQQLCHTTGIHDNSAYRSYCQKVARIGVQVASALDHAHRRGLIHRDIKPANLLLDGNGTVWITDFGLATTGESSLTRTGQIVGTLRFIAPERFSGQCDPRSDIYALGITLYEMLAFRRAFDADEQANLLEKIRTSRPARLRVVDARIPADLDTIVEKAIDPDPNRRYATAAELSADLQRFVENRPIQARRISPLGRLVRWSQRNRAVAALTFGLLLGLLALTSVSLVAANSFRLQANSERMRANAESKLRAEEQQGRKLAENVRDFIVQSYGAPNLDLDGQSITVYEVLKRETANVPTAYQDDRLTQAVLFHAIGDSFESLSEYPDAIAALQSSVRLYQEILGDVDRRTLDAMSSLVNAYVSNQQGPDATELAQRALQLVSLHHGDDEDLVLAAENDLASAYFANGEDLQAALLFESVLLRMRDRYGNQHDETLNAMYNLIQAYHWLSRSDDERALANEFLQISEQRFSADSLDVAKAKEVVAEAMSEDQRAEELQHRQHVYDVRVEQLGKSHSKTLDAMSSLATTYLQIGNVEEGLTLKRMHYDQCREKYGEIHRSTVASATGMARALADSGDELSAIEWLERALEIGRQIDPESDPNLLNTKQGLAYYHYHNGNPHRALELYQDIFENGLQSTGFQTTRTKLAMQSSITIAHELRQLETAENLARRFHEYVYEQEEAAGWEVVGANAALAALMYDRGHYDESLDFADKAIAVPLEGSGFPRGVVRSRMIRGLILIRRGGENSIPGAELLEESFAEFRAELPQMSPLARWMAARACQRAVDLFNELNDLEQADLWSDRLMEVTAEIEALQ